MVISYEEVYEELYYDPEMGLFWWKKSRKGRPGIGRVAGTISTDGYCRIRIFGVHYLAHRLAWLIQTGAWPSSAIDHRNGNPHDNRWINLRLATQSQNNGNMRRPKRNKSGYKGVRFFAGKWRASIQLQGKRRHLGYFETVEQAHAAYVVAANDCFKEFARGN